MTVRSSQAVQEQLAACLDQHRAVDLDCTDVTAVDLSFIQLLLAARKSAAAAGIALRVRHPAGGVLHDALVRVGLVGAQANPSDPGQAFPGQAFWLDTLEASDGQDHPHGG